MAKKRIVKFFAHEPCPTTDTMIDHGPYICWNQQTLEKVLCALPRIETPNGDLMSLLFRQCADPVWNKSWTKKTVLMFISSLYGSDDEAIAPNGEFSVHDDCLSQFTPKELFKHVYKDESGWH